MSQHPSIPVSDLFVSRLPDGSVALVAEGIFLEGGEPVELELTVEALECRQGGRILLRRVDLDRELGESLITASLLRVIEVFGDGARDPVVARDVRLTVVNEG